MALEDFYGSAKAAQEFGQRQRYAQRGDMSMADVLRLKMGERQMTADQKRQSYLQELSTKAVGGNQSALAQLVASDPQRASQLLAAQKQGSDIEQAGAKQRAEKGARLAADVLRVPEAQRPAAYAGAIAQAKQEGLSVEGLPETYTPEAENALNQLVASALPVQDPLKARKTRAETELAEKEAANFATNTKMEKLKLQAAVRDASKGTVYTKEEKEAGVFAVRIGNSTPAIFDMARAGNIPNITAAAIRDSDFGNVVLSEGEQVYFQAARDVINSILRRESGAVISKEEFDNARRQYIPIAGDSPEVIARKDVNLATQYAAFDEGSAGFSQRIRDRLPKKQGVTQPDSSSPKGVDPQVWEFMNDEEKALWQR